MADQHEIDFEILPDGTVKIDLIGYKGQACEAEMKKIARAIGVAVQSKKKAEYFDDTKVRIKQS